MNGIRPAIAADNTKTIPLREVRGRAQSLPAGPKRRPSPCTRRRRAPAQGERSRHRPRPGRKRDEARARAARYHCSGRRCSTPPGRTAPGPTPPALWTGARAKGAAYGDGSRAGAPITRPQRRDGCFCLSTSWCHYTRSRPLLPPSRNRLTCPRVCWPTHPPVPGSKICPASLR